jgi:aspartate kinase
MIVQNVSTGDRPLTDLSFTLDESQGDLAMNLLRAAEEKIGYTSLDYDDQVGKISLVGAGMKTNTGVSFKFFQALAQADINVDMISTSEVRLSVITDVRKLDTAVRALHTAFGLDADSEATVHGGTGR